MKIRMGIIRRCDKCGKEDNINCENGLCPSCENNLKNINLIPQKEVIKYIIQDNKSLIKCLKEINLICRNIDSTNAFEVDIELDRIMAICGIYIDKS